MNRNLFILQLKWPFSFWTTNTCSPWLWYFFSDVIYSLCFSAFLSGSKQSIWSHFWWSRRFQLSLLSHCTKRGGVKVISTLVGVEIGQFLPLDHICPPHIKKTLCRILPYWGGQVNETFSLCWSYQSFIAVFVLFESI